MKQNLRAEDIMKNLSKENIEKYIEISKKLLKSYNEEEKYKEDLIELNKELDILEEYYNENYKEKKK